MKEHMTKPYEIGKTYKNRHGTSVEIVCKVDCDKRILVKVLGTDKSFVTHKTLLRSGGFKTPLCKTVYGVGYLGFGDYTCRDITGAITQEYSAWANMIKRCYTSYKGNRCPDCYDNTKVCDEWLNFQVFAKWYDEKTEKFYQNNIKPKIDKDLLSKDNRGILYSPDSVVVVPNIINCNLVQKRKTNKLHNGIYLRNGNYAAAITSDYNTVQRSFTNEQDAVEFYLMKKKEFIICLAERYKHVLDKSTYETLINWQWRINE